MFTFRQEKKESEDQDEKPVQRDTDTFDTPKEASDHSPRSQKSVPNQITIEWSNLRVTAKLPKKKICDGKQEENRKTILDGVDGIALPGTLTALMGSSGAGKTTLLNVLNRTGINNLEIESGEILVNGNTVAPNVMSKMAGFVQQEDLFFGTLRVREHLKFQANLRMKGASKEDMNKKVESIMQSVGLKQCEDSIIGIPGQLKGISGGESKRLSFAAELLTDPMVMFCDEPTSGLDSFRAQTVVQVLKSMAASGKTIVATIHQPSSEIFHMFDDLYIMGEGKLCFAGTIDESVQFFTGLGFRCPPNYNLADHIIHTLAIVPGEELDRRKRVQDICKSYQVSSFGEKYRALIEANAVRVTKSKHHLSTLFSLNAYYTSPCNQIKWLLYRNFKRIIRDPYLVAIKILEALVLALILGAIYFKVPFDEQVVMNYSGILFFLCTDICYDVVYGTVDRFPQDIPMMNRDRTSGLYSPTAFYFAQLICSVLSGLIVVFIRVTVIYWMVDFDLKDYHDQVGLFFFVLLVYEIIMQVTVAYGLMICSIGGSMSMSMALANPFMLIPLLFTGFFISAKSIPSFLRWICYTSFFYYGFETLSILLWRKAKQTQAKCHGNQTAGVPYEKLLADRGYSEDNLSRNIIMLFVLLCCYHIIALIALNVRYRRR